MRVLAENPMNEVCTFCSAFVCICFNLFRNLRRDYIRPAFGSFANGIVAGIPVYISLYNRYDSEEGKMVIALLNSRSWDVE